MKKTLAIMIVGLVASSAMAGITDDGAAYDRFYTGAWTNNFGTWRDNIDANGDTWLAANMGHIYRDENGVGWVGAYVGSSGDFNQWEYAFTATEAITDQDLGVKLTVNRVDNDRFRNVRMDVSVNGTTTSGVFLSETFGDDSSAPPADYMSSVVSGFGQDGPEAFYNVDLSALNIQAGDSVIYKFRMPQNSPNGSNSKNIGLAVALIPEPATMSLLGFGALALIRRKK